jgi:MoaA/NifB/PqqE/SkfB family radical SAM enzyme
VHTENAKLRALYGEKKKKETQSKGTYSEDEIEDLFDVTESLEGFDIDEIAVPMSQKEKEIAFGKSEEARVKMEKALKKKALDKAREKRKPIDDLDLSDPPSSDGGNDPFEDSDEGARVMEEGRKRKRPARLLRPRMEFNKSIMVRMIRW